MQPDIVFAVEIVDYFMQAPQKAPLTCCEDVIVMHNEPKKELVHNLNGGAHLKVVHIFTKALPMR